MGQERLVNGLHHVTALAADPQENLAFYAGALGLRLVKKTVNFDAPHVYHLYFGDQKGSPGSLLTFFPYGSHIHRGKPGAGMATGVSFSAPVGARPAWEKRLSRFGIPADAASSAFGGEDILSFEDPDGLAVQVVFSALEERPAWETGPVPAEHALRGLHGVTLMLEEPEETGRFLEELLDHRVVAEKDGLMRWSASGVPGSYIDLVAAEDTGAQGAGSIHHVAFATRDLTTQNTLRDRLLQHTRPTPPIDRSYFMSVYFHEPGGVLFEIATEGPGFGVDEPWDTLGQALKLPPQYEARRRGIEADLAPLSLAPETWQ